MDLTIANGPEILPDRSADAWSVLERLGVDPAEHFARMLLPNSSVNEKRYARKGTQAVTDSDGKLIGYILCDP